MSHFTTKRTLFIASLSLVIFFFQNCGSPIHEKTLSSSNSSNNNDSPNTGKGYEKVDFTCNPNALPRPTDLRRLSKVQLKNSIRSLIRGLTEDERNTAYTKIFEVDFPNDEGQVFAREDNNIDSPRINAYFEISRAAAKHLTSTTTLMNKFVSHYIDLAPTNCATFTIATPTDPCIQTFVRNFGLRVFRRPLDSTELPLFTNTYKGKGSIAAGFSAVIFRFLLAPQFLMQIENQGTSLSDPDYIQLTSYELASKLSYHFTNNMPSESLLNVAANDGLLNPTIYEAEVNKLINNSATPNTFNEFFSGWLALGDVKSFSGVDAPEFKHLAGSITYDDNLKNAMVDEIKELTNYITWSANGSFKDLFMTDISFARNENLKKVYKVTQSAPQTITAANAVRLPAAERAGLLTRAAFLISGDAFENPIKRGVHLLTDFLCLPPPSPDNANLPDGSLDLPPVDLNATTRDRYDKKTSNPMCFTCHFGINGLGFAFTHYNALGQFRTEEAIFNENGAFVKNLPIFADSDLSGIVGSTSHVKTPVQLSEAIGSSLHSQKCLTKFYFQFAGGRPTDTTEDGCALLEIRKTMDNPESNLKDVFKSIALGKAFKTRTVKK